MKLIVGVILAVVVVMAAQTAEPVAVAFYHIRAGQGIQPLRGHAALFVDGHNCTEANKPRNAWGAGIIQRDPGFTGMLNRAGCGTPEGAPWKRIDCAWVKGMAPIAIERFGMPAPGEAAPSDHVGIVATFR